MVQEHKETHSAMTTLQPPYTLTDNIVGLTAEIAALAAILELRQATPDPRLRRKNRIRTIHSSLAIEHNSLSLEQVTAILDGKRVLGPPSEIREVANAHAAYQLLDTVRPFNMDDLLRVHGVMMQGLVEEAGRFRSGNIGVHNGHGKVLHLGTPPMMVPVQMAKLMSWVQSSTAHSLVKSCVFHYELEFIHPFADGNGRMGRYWQTVLLASWMPQMAWVPVEEVIKGRQDAYYQAIADADSQGDSQPFIEFMLAALRDALQEIAKSAGKGAGKSVGKILALLRLDPKSTREQLAAQAGLSVRGVEKILRKLKDEGRIQRMGGNKGGQWQINEDE